MRWKTLLCAGLAALSGLLAAGDRTGTPVETEKGWTVFELGILPGVPDWDPAVRVTGLKIGAPISTGDMEVYGLDISFLGSGAGLVAGAQISSAAAWAMTVDGLQLAPVTVAERCNGLQFGVVNIAKTGAVQLGLLNFIEDSPLPFMILGNVYFGSERK